MESYLIQQIHTKLLPDRRTTGDHVTDIIWEELLKFMFDKPKMRAIAPQVVAWSEKVLEFGRNQASVKPKASLRRLQTASAAIETQGLNYSPPHTPPNRPLDHQGHHRTRESFPSEVLTAPHDERSTNQQRPE